MALILPRVKAEGKKLIFTITDNNKTTRTIIDFNDNLIDISDINTVMLDLYNKKYPNYNNSIAQSLYTIHDFDNLAAIFDKALDHTFDETVALIKIFDNCSVGTKFGILFTVISLVARHSLEYNDIDREADTLMNKINKMRV